MLGLGMTAQKKLIPFAVDQLLPTFVKSVEDIVVSAGVPPEKLNSVEPAIFFFWSMRLGIISAEGSLSDKYAADVVLETAIKRWVARLAKATGQNSTGRFTREFYAFVKKMYVEYDNTMRPGLFRRGQNGNVDMPITEKTISLFVSRLAIDDEVFARLSGFGGYFSAVLSEGQWAAAGIMKPRITEVH